MSTQPPVTAPSGDPDPEATLGEATDSFAGGRRLWLEREPLLRNTVRQELIRRQLEVHLPLAPATVLDVGAGQGSTALALAAAGYQVTCVEPDETMRAVLADRLTAAGEQVAARVRVVAGSVETLDWLPELDGLTYDAVLCHGVLMYLPDPNPAIRALGRRVAADGIMSLVARNAASLAFRPAHRGDAAGAMAAFAEVERAGWERRDPSYVNELGVRCRADSLEQLGAYLGGSRCAVEYWYGVRILSDAVPLDQPVPDDPAELEQLIALEERLGRTEPYRRLGTLLHVVGRRGEGRGPQL